MCGKEIEPIGSNRGTSWAKCSKGGVVLALGTAHHPGTRLLCPRDAGSWFRSYGSKKRQEAVTQAWQRQWMTWEGVERKISLKDL